MRSRAVVWAAVVWLAATPAVAGLFEDVFRGLDILATPSGTPLQLGPDGSRINGARSGRLRIVPNRLGRGYRLEFDRSFGQDSRGRPEVLDLGPVELQLSGNVQSTLSYTRRGFLSANADTTVTNLQYSLRGKTGAQDAELRGTLDVTSRLELNQFGFYSLNLNVTNANSSLVVDGVVADEQFPTNFNVGPINVEGNLLLDGLIAILAGMGANTGDLEAITPRSPIDRIADAIREQVLAQAQVAGIQVTQDVDLTTGADRLPGGMGAARVQVVEGPAVPSDVALPEPAGAWLLMAAAGVLLRRRAAG